MWTLYILELQPKDEIIPQFGRVKFTPEEKLKIQQLLQEKVGPDVVSFRPGPNEKQVAYIACDNLIKLANDIFGPSGWSSSVTNLQQEFLEEVDGRYRCACSALVRIQLKDGTYHEDIGYGLADGQKTVSAAIEKAKKIAVSDGMKRALRLFGNKLGNCLADSQYVSHIENGYSLGNPSYLSSTRSAQQTVINTSLNSESSLISSNSI